MRLRLPELLEARELTAYALAKQSDGRITRSLAYRLVSDRGTFKCLRPEQLEALCDLLEVSPGELFERARPRKRKA